MSKMNKRQGFSLVEVVIAVAIGSIVIGGGMLLYLQGNKYFYKTTEHSSFRAETLVILERVGEDLDQLQVSTGKDPDPGHDEYLLVEPFRFLEPFSMAYNDLDGNLIENVDAGKGLRFYRFHHLEMSAPDVAAGLPNGKPRLVGRALEYTQAPVDASDPSKGVNLLRNGVPVNQIPLEKVIFHQEPMNIAASQVQGSRNAIITVTVVPKGGLFQNTDYNTLSRLQSEGALVSRTFHLIGYESFYTSVLYSALQKQAGNGGTLDGIDDLQQAILVDASNNTPPGILNNLSTGVGTEAPPTHLIPSEAFVIDVSKSFEDSSAAVDEGWMAAPATPGRPAGEGEFTFEDNGAGPGSGSGSGSGSASSEGGSGSG